MNLLRILKFKQLNEDINSIDEKEKFFISLFNDAISSKVGHVERIKYKDGKEFFCYNYKYNELWCSHLSWGVLEYKYIMDTKQIEEFYSKMFEKYFNIKNVHAIKF